MDDAWADARERGITRATLEVAVSNKRAQSLYFRYGFSPVGVRKNYYEKNARRRPDSVGRPRLSDPQARPTLDRVALVLGIETSCDETAAAVVDEEFHVHSSVVESSIDQHRAFGGVVPELAGRAHVATIGPVVRRALDDAGLDPRAPAISGVAVTSGPGLIGSLLVGLSAAKALRVRLGRALRRGQPPRGPPLRAAARSARTSSGPS